jgi:hypothetical protein
MLVLAMEFSRGTGRRCRPSTGESDVPAASGRHTPQTNAAPTSPREASEPAGSAPLPQNGTEVPDHPRSAPRETDGLRPGDAWTAE